MLNFNDILHFNVVPAHYSTSVQLESGLFNRLYILHQWLRWTVTHLWNPFAYSFTSSCLGLPKSFSLGRTIQIATESCNYWGHASRYKDLIYLSHITWLSRCTSSGVATECSEDRHIYWAVSCHVTLSCKQSRRTRHFWSCFLFWLSLRCIFNLCLSRHAWCDQVHIIHMAQVTWTMNRSCKCTPLSQWAAPLSIRATDQLLYFTVPH